MRLALVALLISTPALGQGSPYIPLDHPLLPLAELLIGRGAIRDPSPMVRPFRRADLLAVIAEAKLEAATADGKVAAELEAAFRDRDDDAWFRIAPRAGAYTSTRARRDLLHPAGDSRLNFYADAAIEGRIGNLVGVSRPATENRLKEDPDWAGGVIQRRKNQAHRFIDGYLALQFRRVRVFYGQMDRNWGPAGSLGLSIANYGYPRSDIGLDLLLRDLQFNVVGTQLTDMTSTDGTTHKRYFLAHRLNVRVTSRLNLALWETGVLAGREQSFDPTFRNPMFILSWPLQFGQEDNRNAILGGDLEWRVGKVRLQGQAMIDDRWRNKPDPDGTGEPAHPGRWGLTAVGSGPLASRALWRVGFSIINSLAYRTGDSAQSYLDRGVGIGPHFTDNYLLQGSITVPVFRSWTFAPDITVLKQGEGRIDAPFPSGQALTDTPELFIGTPATTYRLGAQVSGGWKALNLQGDLGLHHTTNLSHVRGRSRTRFEARVLTTLGFSVGRALR